MLQKISSCKKLGPISCIIKISNRLDFMKHKDQLHKKISSASEKLSITVDPGPLTLSNP